MSSNDVIYFSHDGKYPELSNHFLADIQIGSRTYSSVTHYVEAQKFVNSPQHFNQILEAETALDAKKIGEDPQLRKFVRTNWKTMREAAMKTAVTSKFFQNEDLRDLLMDTYEQSLELKWEGDERELNIKQDSHYHVIPEEALKQFAMARAEDLERRERQEPTYYNNILGSLVEQVRSQCWSIFGEQRMLKTQQAEARMMRDNELAARLEEREQKKKEREDS